jgi:hypothetical protein
MFRCSCNQMKCLNLLEGILFILGKYFRGKQILVRLLGYKGKSTKMSHLDGFVCIVH